MKTRPRGSGHLYQRKYKVATGEWRTGESWSAEFYDRATGKRRRLHGFATKTAAAEAVRNAMTDQSNGRLPSKRVERTTFADLVQVIRDDYMLNGRVVKRLETSLTHLTASFGGARLVSDISEENIVRYTAARRRAGAASASVNRELSALKRMFHLGEQQRMVQRRPHVQLLEENNVRTGHLTPDQVGAVLAKLPAGVREAVAVAAVTGWRVHSEILTRQWRHVDFDGGWLLLDAGEGKTGERRQFPLDPDLRPLLASLRASTTLLEESAHRIVPWVFHREGRPIKSFRRVWRSACRAAGVPGRLPHDLRRSAVIRMERSGLGRATAMKLVGHKTESVYRRYRIVDEADLKAGAAAASMGWTKPADMAEEGS